MTVKLLTEQHLRFLSLKGGCIGSSESTLLKISHCWKSHVTAQFVVVVSGQGPPKRGGGRGGGGGPHGINLEAEETEAIHDVKKRAAEDAEDARLKRD